MENEQKLKEAFAEALEIDESAVNDELKYQGIEEWDSVSHMVLISELEDVFDVSIETSDVIDMSSFAKAREILNKYGVQFS